LWRETKIEDVLPWEDIKDEAERLLDISKGGRDAAKEGHDSVMKNWRTTKRWGGMKQTHTTKSFLGEGDLILAWSIGPTRSFMCWNSSVRQISDETTESVGNM